MFTIFLRVVHVDYTDFLNGNVTSLQVIGNAIFI
jgi:hypothetical protein